MDTAVKPVQSGRRRRWSAEQKLIVLQEWQTGIPLEEICRKYAMNAAQMYHWKRSLDQELKEPGELVPKSQVLGFAEIISESATRASPAENAGAVRTRRILIQTV